MFSHFMCSFVSTPRILPVFLLHGARFIIFKATLERFVTLNNVILTHFVGHWLVLHIPGPETVPRRPEAQIPKFTTLISSLHHKILLDGIFVSSSTRQQTKFSGVTLTGNKVHIQRLEGLSEETTCNCEAKQVSLSPKHWRF